MADNISEDFTDLTVEEGADEIAETEAEEYKPVKAPKPPRQPRQPSEAGSETEAEAVAAITRKSKKVKKKKGRLIKIILLVVLVLLVGGFVFEEVYFNYLGLRDKLIESIVELDPDYRSRQETLNERESDLIAYEAQLDAREKTIASRESQNDRRSAELSRQQESLQDREERLTPLYQRQMSEQEQEDMLSLSRTYARMAPEDAASILLELNNADDVAAILYNMSERNAAAILAVMEPEYAAVITEILLYN
ncbi:MAG: hypothetical protein FWH33_07250 [Oscillospiraceae bacterium]|nr:hypothetical protein [Oscillospiraceae bacterium]